MFSITIASVGLLTALLALGMSSAPGRRELRWFALCAALAALFNLSNVLVTMRVPVGAVLLGSRASGFFEGLHTAAWFAYAAAHDRRRLTRFERVLVGLGVFLSVATLVPGLVLQDRLLVREVSWLGISYADAPPTAFGMVALPFHAAGLVLLLVRFGRRVVRGDRGSRAQCAALAAVSFAATHDTLASADLVGGPYILDLALLVMVLAVGGSLTSSFVSNARALEVAARRLASAQEELVKRERLAALGELAAVVAHEVRNPLAIVFNAMAGLRKAPLDDDDHRALLQIVQEEAERLRDIVSHLLAFARPHPPVLASVALETVVRSAIEASREENGAKEEDVALVVEASASHGLCDERLVRQAVTNLVTNALQAPKRRGPVRVRVEEAPDERDEGSIVIRVIDDGSGVPPELGDRIFTPFFTTRATGTGLGLAVVRSSAEAHGGDVTLSDTPGGGATFTLRLPRRRKAG